MMESIKNLHIFKKVMWNVYVKALVVHNDEVQKESTAHYKSTQPENQKNIEILSRVL